MELGLNIISLNMDYSFQQNNMDYYIKITWLKIVAFLDTSSMNSNKVQYIGRILEKQKSSPQLFRH